MPVQNKSVILYDGECNLCNSSINFIVKRDTKRLYQYVSLQSSQGQEYLKKYGLPLNTYDTVILIEDKKTYIKSTAVLKICKTLSGAIRYVYYFIFVPRFIRDFLYDVVAKMRHTLFNNSSCKTDSHQ